MTERRILRAVAMPEASPTIFGEVRRLAEIDSTNRYLLDEARAGAAAGLVVVADHQTAGRGRLGRTWVAPPGASLLMSLLLRPTVPVDRRHVLVMAAGLAMAEAVETETGVIAGLKWPNDLLVGERKLAGILAEAAGPEGMVGGQMADLQAEGRGDGTVEALEAIHRRKTGALLRAPLRMGAVVAAAPGPEVEALDAYGRAVGLAFQIVDDLLDVQGDEAKLGKRVNKDSGLGKWTYPAFLGVEGSRRKAAQLADEAVAALAPLGERGDRLRALALDLLERDR